MGGDFGNAAGSMGNISATNISTMGVDPQFGMAKAIEGRQMDEQMFAKYGLFSPIGSLKNVLSMGENPEKDAQIMKWRSEMVDNIESMPIAVGYSLFGELYPKLLDHKLENSKLYLSLRALQAKGAQQESENLTTFVNYRDARMKLFKDEYGKDPQKAVQGLLKMTTQPTGRKDLRDVDQLNAMYYTALDTYGKIQAKTDKTPEDYAKLEQVGGVMSSINRVMYNKAQQYFYGQDQMGNPTTKSAETYALIRDLSANQEIAREAMDMGAGTNVYQSKDNPVVGKLVKVGKATEESWLKNAVDAISKDATKNPFEMIGRSLDEFTGGIVGSLDQSIDKAGVYSAMGDVLSSGYGGFDKMKEVFMNNMVRDSNGKSTRVNPAVDTPVQSGNAKYGAGDFLQAPPVATKEQLLQNAPVVNPYTAIYGQPKGQIDYSNPDSIFPYITPAKKTFD